MQINRERLAATFTQLCETDSPSRQEGKIARLLIDLFTDFGPAEWFEDDSATVTDSECGNLLFRFQGGLDRTPLFFTCHMDTVQPGIGVKVARSGDRFTSAGNTILGSDDKSGIAALIEAMQVLQDNGHHHAPVEFLFTTCEEIGLLGAKAFSCARLRAKTGYALDSSGAGRVIIGAPAANRLHITMRGIAAHAGLHPEWGVNAITLAGKALAAAPVGRIDEESTVNFGIIQGGVASNIVPELVTISGEVRSHCTKKLTALTDEVEQAFKRVVQQWQDPHGSARGKPTVEVDVQPDFPPMRLKPEDYVIKRVAEAAAAIGMDLRYEVAGGGSDANIFNGGGIKTAIIATGMTHVHSTDEEVSLQDMEELTQLILALLTA